MPEDPASGCLQDYVHRLVDGHIIRSHAPKPPSPPSSKLDHHEIEETDIFAIMSSKESTAGRSFVVFNYHEKSISRSTTPDAHDQERPTQTVDQLVARMGLTSDIPLHRPPQYPALVRHSSRHGFDSSSTPVACNMTDDAEIFEDSIDSETDHDLDLEGDVDRALSDWYGIRLRELPRPFRIVHLFEELKEKCAKILEDEGFGLYLDQNDTPTPTEDEQSAQDGSAASQSPKGNQRLSSALGQPSAALKRKSGRMGETMMKKTQLIHPSLQ